MRAMPSRWLPRSRVFWFLSYWGAVSGCLALRAWHDTPAELTVELLDPVRGSTVPGNVRITDANGKLVPLNGLISRTQWWVLPKATKLMVPRTKLFIEAFHGLETEIGRATVDLTGQRRAAVEIPLVRFYDASAKGMRGGNTHLHLRNISQEESDRYVREVPAADDLDVLFVSFLQGWSGYSSYSTNRYTPADLRRLSGTTLLGHGEEHRHFGPEGAGSLYGHVMFL